MVLFWLNYIFYTDFLKVDLQISAKFEPVAYGSKIELEAWIQSYPLPTGFQWWKNHEVIIPDGRKIFEDKSDVKNPKLRIENVDTSDSGNYGITVTNPLRSVEEHKDLKVVGMQNYETFSQMPSSIFNFYCIISIKEP